MIAQTTKLEEQMLRVRIVEDALQQLCDRGLAGDLHFGRGQEGIAAGVCASLHSNDILLTHHRMIPWAISKGIPLRPLIAELLGKAEGLCGGLAGEMHLRAPEYGFAHSFQLVGTVVPVAAGVAWALKNYKRSDGIAVAVFGEAAGANGQFHEGLNIAAVQNLPLLLVCENNGLAGNVKSDKYQPVHSVAQRADGYGIRSTTVDGNDVEAVVEAAEDAITYVRKESAPFLLECVTWRLGKHKQGMGDIRSRTEMEVLNMHDPLNEIFQRTTAGTLREMHAEIETVIQEVLAGPDPVRRV